MKQLSNIINVKTNGTGLYEFTRDLANWCNEQPIREGLLTVFIRHTSASLTIQENADPDVCRDLTDFFEDIAPRHRAYRHSAEGPDDMPAHIKAALTQTQLSIPLSNGRLVLGTWQGVYVFEHRDHSHRRQVAVHLMGE